MGDQSTVSTHKYSKTFFTVKIISAVFLGTLIGVITFIIFIDAMRENFLLALGILSGTVIFSTLIHIFGINRIYDTLSTLAYIKNELQTEISYADAAFLKKIFEPAYIKSDEWVSMRNIVALPDNMRRKAVMDTANRILKYKAKTVSKKR